MLGPRSNLNNTEWRNWQESYHVLQVFLFHIRLLYQSVEIPEATWNRIPHRNSKKQQEYFDSMNRSNNNDDACTMDVWNDSDSDDYIEREVDVVEDSTSVPNSFLINSTDIHMCDPFADLTQASSWVPTGLYVRSNNENMLMQDNSATPESFHTTELVNTLNILEEYLLNEDDLQSKFE
jgi:hypothetical protein